MPDIIAEDESLTKEEYYLRSLQKPILLEPKECQKDYCWDYELHNVLSYWNYAVPDYYKVFDWIKGIKI